MKTLFEELMEKGLSANKLTLELAWTIPYSCATDKIIGSEIITYKSVEVSQN